MASLSEALSPDLKKVLRRLKLGQMQATLPERLLLARQRKMPHETFLLQVLADECQRRDQISADTRAHKGRLDPTMGPGGLGRHGQDHVRRGALGRALHAAIPRGRSQKP